MTAKSERSSVPDRIKKAASFERRSSLYLWMRANYDEFRATVAEAGRPNWRALAEAFAAEGLMDLKERPPTAEGARLTWLKVRKIVETRQASAAKRATQATPRFGAPMPAIRLPATVPLLSTVDVEPPRERRPIVLRAARTLGPDELPEDDGSKLPKPFARTRK